MMRLEKGKCCISPFPCFGGPSKNGARFSSAVLLHVGRGVPQSLGLRLCRGGCRYGAMLRGNLFSARFLLAGTPCFDRKQRRVCLSSKAGSNLFPV